MSGIFMAAVFPGMFIIYAIKVNTIQLATYDIRLERTEPIIGDKETLIDFDGLKFIRFEKTYYLNGSWIHYIDMDNTYQISVSLQHSSRGDGNFIKHPYQVPKIGTCDYFNTTFKKYTMPSYMGRSNFPNIPPEGLCPIPKGNYYVKMVNYENKMLPQRLQSGIWRIDKLYYNKENDIIGGVRYYLRLTN